MRLVLVSGLSGSGKSIALHVLEDAGYYCVDNLPATLLLEVADFLADAGHDEAAISVDARSAALAALPEHVAALKERGAAGIDADRRFIVAGIGEDVRDLQKQRGRQVVHAVVPRVLEHVEGDTFSGSGETADQN